MKWKECKLKEWNIAVKKVQHEMSAIWSNTKKVQHEQSVTWSNTKRMKHNKSPTWKELTTRKVPHKKWCNMKRVHHEKRRNMKRVQHTKKCNMELVQHEKNATRENFEMKECNMKKVQQGNNATWPKCNTKKVQYYRPLTDRYTLGSYQRCVFQSIINNESKENPYGRCELKNMILSHCTLEKKIKATLIFNNCEICLSICMNSFWKTFCYVTLLR